MPRPGPRREFVGVRLSPTGLEAVQAIADAEHGGNLSDAIRTLLAEAIQTRAARTGQRPGTVSR